MERKGAAPDDGAGPATETVVLGLAGSQTLITAVRDTLDHLHTLSTTASRHEGPTGVAGRHNLQPSPDHHRCHIVTIARHGFSLGQHASHNVRIEPGVELEFYQFLERARVDNPHLRIRSFTQSSFDGAAPVSRLCGVQLVDGAGPHAPLLPTAATDDKDVLECAARLCEAVERAQCAPSGDRHRQLLGWELKRLLGFTDARKGYHATFLHDAKVYFAAACFDRLVAMGVLAERQLSILASPDAVELVITAASDAAHRGTHVTDVVVAPGRALDFTREFARWLEDQNRRSPPVDTVVTDLGCGHNGREGNWLVAQDCDDAAALLLAGPIRRLFVCDETPLLSRAAAALAHFGHQVSGGIVSGQVAVHTHQVHPDAEATCKMLTSRVRIALAKNDGAGAAVLNGAFEAVAELRPHHSAAFDAIAAAERALRHLSAPPPTATLQLACRVCGEINAAETEAVSRQCFVPTLVQLDALIAQSVLAEADLAAGRRTKLVSKLPHVAPLCPPSLDPGDTILVKLGRAHGRIGDGTYRAIPDQALVYWTSFGSNSVYLEPDNDTRINLVYRSRAAIADMLDAYFAVRAAWLPAIIKMIPDKIRECKLESGGYAKHFPHKFDADGNVDTVPDVWWPAFDAVADMLDAVGVRLRWALWHAGPDAVPAVVLRQCLGLELISLCQTWMRGSGVIGDAEFSVMSPHFQNRLVVVDAEKLMSCCGVTASHLEAYSTLGKQFAANMEAAQYSGPKGAAFMHLDKLRLLL